MTSQSPAAQSPVSGVAATGAGELAGVSALESARVVAGELGADPHLPYLPWLPDRGPGGDAVGRTAALLSAVTGQFALTTTPAGWRLASGDPIEMRRARSWLGEDLDAAEEQLLDSHRSVVLTMVGPWTMAAQCELTTGHRLVRDHAAVLDLAQALGAAAQVHLADVQRRLPGVTPLLRIDEPLLTAVMTGAIATPSGLDRYRSVAESVAADRLRTVAESADLSRVVVRGGRAPLSWSAMAATRCGGWAFDLDAVDLARDGNAIGDHIDAGGWVMLGLPVRSGSAPRDRIVTANAHRVTQWWHNLGFEHERLTEVVSVTPQSSALPSGDPVDEFTLLRLLSARLRDTSSAREDNDE